MQSEHKNLYFKCSVNICQTSVEILSSDSRFDPNFGGDLERDYQFDIPGWSITYNYDLGNPSIVYIPDPEVNFSYNPNNRQMVINGPRKYFLDGQALAYLAYWLSEGERQKDRIFSMHSAAAAVDDKGILLIGDKGAGKTTTLMDLSKRYNAELVSNDLSIVSHLDENTVQIIDGSKRIRLRLGSVRNHFPELLNFFPNLDGSTWETKVLVSAERLGINVRNLQLDLREAFLIHLSNDLEEPLKIKRASGLPIFFELYENLSRIIRGSGVSIFGSDGTILGFIPSLETKRTHQNKVNFLNHLVNDRGIWSISGGNLEKMTDAIYNQVAKN